MQPAERIINNPVGSQAQLSLLVTGLAGSKGVRDNSICAFPLTAQKRFHKKNARASNGTSIVSQIFLTGRIGQRVITFLLTL
jgi:hypothetical protein